MCAMCVYLQTFEAALFWKKKKNILARLRIELDILDLKNNASRHEQLYLQSNATDQNKKVKMKE